MLYDPTAIALVNGKPEYLFTSSMCNSIEDAKKCFYSWQDQYNFTILSWWIKDEHQNVIEEDICFNNAGQLVDLDGNRISIDKKQI